MDWDYNLLKPGTLTTNNYFNFDTANNLLLDKPGRPSSPYTVQTIFSGSPLTDAVPFTNPVFKIDPALIMHDAYKNYQPWADGGSALQIDFGDGTGWHVVDMSGVHYYQAHYSGSGLKAIKFGIFYSSVLTRYSIAGLRVNSDNAATVPNEEWTDIPGIKVNVFGGCVANADKKYVIYLEGFDFLNNRHASKIYDDMLKQPDIVQLQNFGYTFLVVDWNDAGHDMKDNAMSIVKLINKLKQQAEGQALVPFVVIGESMGGLIARYALSYMESPAYVNDNSNPSPAYMHNTRLLMTFDSPNQGANIPLGLQWLYRYVLNFTMLQSTFAKNILNDYKIFLDCDAARQMLLYHVETEAPPALVSTSTYEPSQMKRDFDNDLAGLGNYPKYCKLVATSNGSWLGKLHTRWWDAADRIPNDHMMNFEAETYISVLGTKLWGTRKVIDVRTNPDGTGDVFVMNDQVQHWKIKLVWFGIKFSVWYADILKVQKTAKNVKAYCVNAGSYPIDDNKPFYSGIGNNDMNIFGMFQCTAYQNNGQLNYNTSAGGHLISANLDFSFYSDGQYFSLVPVQSSFDYSDDRPLDYPIMHDPIAVTMVHTPFDVVITNPSRENRNHLHEEVPILNYCQTCLSSGKLIASRLINREIGDDELYLENTQTAIPWRIEAERDLYINYRNPYYNYPSQNSQYKQFTYNPNGTQYDTNGEPDLSEFTVMSKENPYTINTYWPGIFGSNSSFNINPAQPLAGPYQYQPGNMVVCCTDFKNIRKTNDSVGYSRQLKKSMVVYPNPVMSKTGSIIIVKYQFTENGLAKMSISDMTGRCVANYDMPFTDNTQMCYFPIQKNFPPGLYIIRLSCGKEIQTAKLIITAP